MSRFTRQRQLLRPLVAGLGLILGIGLLGLALWFHLQLDSILRIPFVLSCAALGLAMGLMGLLTLLDRGKPGNIDKRGSASPHACD